MRGDTDASCYTLRVATHTAQNTMQSTPVYLQRLAALKIAAEKKQQFNSIEELRIIKAMIVLSFLIEFQCATAQTLLSLLDIKNNAILTHLRKNRLIKIFRWQNSQVYVPTEIGKRWLLSHITDEKEMEQVRDTPIRRKISGYSAEHDILVQNAAINYAKKNESQYGKWRIFKPRKTQITGKVPDALIIFNKEYVNHKVYIEVERTRKKPVDVICSYLRTAELIDTDARAVILCANKKIYNDYLALGFAFTQCGMHIPDCQKNNAGAIERYMLGAANWKWAYDQPKRIEVAQIDEFGASINQHLDFESAMFTEVFWMCALHQEVQDWRHWARVGAREIVSERENADDYLTEDEIEKINQKIADLSAELISALAGEGLEEDNPMRSSNDLRRARERWADARVEGL